MSTPMKFDTANSNGGRRSYKSRSSRVKKGVKTAVLLILNLDRPSRAKMNSYLGSRLIRPLNFLPDLHIEPRLDLEALQ